MDLTTNEHITIPVYEIFGPTSQGEGLHAGKRCMFVRTCGCNDHCSWCDSKFAWKVPNVDAWKTSFEIFDRVAHRGCNTVILTGGNPCLWDFSEFVRICHNTGIRVEVETQGGAYPKWLKEVDLVTFSPKVPSAGARVQDRRDSIYEWILSLDCNVRCRCVIKIPVFDSADIEFAKETFGILRKLPIQDVSTLFDFYLSVGNRDTKTKEPIRETVLDDYEKLINYINDHYEGFEDVSILPQIHTLIWGNKGGV